MTNKIVLTLSLLLGVSQVRGTCSRSNKPSILHSQREIRQALDVLRQSIDDLPHILGDIDGIEESIDRLNQRIEGARATQAHEIKSDAQRG
jgi:hypothetical protein